MEKQSSGGGGEAAAKVPLLEPRAAAGEHHHHKAEAEADWSLQPLRRRAWEENKRLWVVAGPSICARFASFGVTVISQAFIGHIGATELAAYALVSTVLMRFSNGILENLHSEPKKKILNTSCRIIKASFQSIANQYGSKHSWRRRVSGR